jgi:hypothetical protein
MAAIGNSPTQQAFTPAIDYFSGNGSTTAFTLSRPVASVAQVQVTIDNVAQNPSSAYTVSSNTITFTSAPLSGTNNIYVYYTSPITQVIAPGQGTVGTTALVDASVTTAKLASTTGSGAVVLATSPTITTPVISSLSSASATALTLQSAGTTAITVNTSQNVGIGTTSPSAKLHVSGGQSYVTGASSAGAYSRWYNNAQTTGDFQVGQGWLSVSDNIGVLCNNANAAMILATNATERMRIDSTGRFWSGDASPWTVGSGGVNAWALYNGGDFPLTAASQSTITAIFNRCNSTGTIVEFKYNASPKGTVSTDGSTVAYNTSSDYRLKDDVATMTGALNKVSALKPVTWKWKSTGEDGQGFIAHELAEVCPQAVHGTKDEVDADGNPVYQGVDTSFLVATLTAAIQELSAKNDALTARIEALENR